MHIKSKKGLTAMVDAMIFIIIMGLAVSALFYIQNETQTTDADAKDILDNIFTAKIRTDDLIEDGDSKIVSLTDMVAVSLMTESKDAIDYIEEIMDRLTERPGSYSLHLEYKGIHLELGTGEGVPISTAIKDIVVLYGDILRVELALY